MEESDSLKEVNQFNLFCYFEFWFSTNSSHIYQFSCTEVQKKSGGKWLLWNMSVLQVMGNAGTG